MTRHQGRGGETNNFPAEAWRDGYTETISRNSSFSPEKVRAYFDYMIGSIRNPEHYAVWHVPVIGGRKPGP